MNASNKTYIGTGRQKPGSEYIRITLCLEELLAADAMEYDGKHYVRAVVARRRLVPPGGSTHILYVRNTADPKEIEYGRVADQQELESLACED